MKNFRSRRGFALVLVLTLAFALGITAAVLLRYAGTEFRLNQRNQLRFQAKNASEGMLEYGASELMKRLERNVNFSTGELRAAPLQVHNDRKATLFTQANGSYNNVNPTSLSFWASQ
jgi:type II secretory pathway component PulK